MTFIFIYVKIIEKQTKHIFFSKKEQKCAWFRSKGKEGEGLLTGLIGAGRAGSSLGVYLKKCGFTICGYFSEFFSDAEYAAKNTGGKAYKSLEELCFDAELIIICIPDDNIKELVKKIVDSGISLKGKILCHISGALSSDVLSGAKESGAYTASIHPVYTFVSKNSVPEKLKLTAEGDDEALAPFYRAKMDIIKMQKSGKAAYHAAAVFTSNYLVALFAAADKILKESGIRQRAGEIFGPLAEAALQNIISRGIYGALSGPVSRGDVDTVRAHLKAISPIGLDSLYRLLALELLPLADIDKEKMECVLNGDDNNESNNSHS